VARGGREGRVLKGEIARQGKEGRAKYARTAEEGRGQIGNHGRQNGGDFRLKVGGRKGQLGVS